MTKPFHLAWFLSQGYGPKTWRTAWPGADVNRWMMPDLFIDLVADLLAVVKPVTAEVLFGHHDAAPPVRAEA